MITCHETSNNHLIFRLDSKVVSSSKCIEIGQNQISNYLKSNGLTIRGLHSNDIKQLS